MAEESREEKTKEVNSMTIFDDMNRYYCCQLKFPLYNAREEEEEEEEEGT